MTGGTAAATRGESYRREDAVLLPAPNRNLSDDSKLARSSHWVVTRVFCEELAASFVLPCCFLRSKGKVRNYPSQISVTVDF